MLLDFPGYRRLFDSNQVFARDERLQKGAVSITARSFFMPEHYNVPTEDEVVTYLQERLSQPCEGTSPLEQMLQRIPDDTKRKILENDPKTIELVKAKTPAPKRRRSFVKFRCGAVKTEDAKNAKNPEWYEQQYNNGAKECDIYIKLARGALLSKADMDILLKNRSRDAATFWVDEEVQYTEVRDFVRRIYQGLQKPMHIRQLPDTSKKCLDHYCYHTAKRICAETPTLLVVLGPGKFPDFSAN